MDQKPIISKRPLREDVHAVLRERIVAGSYPAGSRLPDVQLAAELGVSRTPVREALLRLVREGLVESDPNRGFFVAKLTRKEVLETYPIVWTLECLALNESAPPTREQLQALRQTNREMGAIASDPARRQELDLRWHQTLLAACGNERLVEMIASLKQLVRRYESVYMRQSALVRRSIVEHTEIAEALSRKRTKAARQLLERHWRAGMDAVLEQLEKVAPENPD